MTRVYFVVPVHGREALTRVCLRQLRRTCDAAREYDADATAVVIGEGDILDFAYDLGFATVERDNTALGRRFNDGYQVACDPRFNPDPADYAVPCGSDDWVDHVIFQRLPPPDTIGNFRQIAIVNEDQTALARLRVSKPIGCGVRIIPASLIAAAGYRPAEEDYSRMIDASTQHGITSALGRRQPRQVFLDVHPLQIVDWKTHGEQLNSYSMLAGRRGAECDVWSTLAEFYPSESLEEMRALDRELVTA